MRKQGVTIKDLMSRQARSGQVVYISIRPERVAPPREVDTVYADADHGLEGDHYAGGADGKRQLTLINEEHIRAVASFVGEAQLDPGLLRRNIVIKGVNLLSLKDRKFSVGDAVLKMTGLCHPCSRMEENLGEGGYNAMRGHGGITATIVKSGWIRKGDKLARMNDE
jgi:MOSC domain-containing protein YiiM